MSRTIVAAGLLLAVAAAPAFAQDVPNRSALAALALSSAAVAPTTSDTPAAATDAQQVPALSRPRFGSRTGSAVMFSLYATTATMQALDVHSTIRAIDRGAVEANPLMGGLVNNRPAFIATKAAVAAGTIFAAREVAKKNKVAAAITLIAINSAYAYVAHHNYKLARQLR
jgi:hypothetical protein